ncbi:MAG: hypothetical protein WKF73_02075 [Nocardioidaceae bacterium]
MVNRSCWTPWGSTIATAWSLLAQSIPAVGAGVVRVSGCRWGLVLVDHGVVLLAVAAADGHPQRFGTRLPVAH